MLLAAGLRCAFWRERLTLDLVQRRYVHVHGDWFTGTLHDLRIGAPFVAIAALFAFFAAVACVLNKEIVETGDSFCSLTRLFGATPSSKTLAKRDIVEVRPTPVPTNA